MYVPVRNSKCSCIRRWERGAMKGSVNCMKDNPLSVMSRQHVSFRRRGQNLTIVPHRSAKWLAYLYAFLYSVGEKKTMNKDRWLSWLTAQ
ncbi:hypothetical protein BDF20DRAFT_441887 [Mycotypha africana]|uniref:uncharacterized protein n=1 Tax=Mycotypha africana TaxID=64632 RepID=UPI00230026DB|nr:uncharacterized protein BDF20DRAFT_441887 [Mycotypha africana]KAI8981939.1 hypothetical protein BDF20DRAFT_441887 [Mycotypha africana]